MVTDFALEPAVFEQVSLYVVVEDGFTVVLPEVLFVPDQPPLAVQVTGVVALLLMCQDNVTLCPLVIEVLLADRVTVGATGAGGGGGVVVPPEPLPDPLPEPVPDPVPLPLPDVLPPEPDEVPPLLLPPDDGGVDDFVVDVDDVLVLFVPPLFTVTWVEALPVVGVVVVPVSGVVVPELVPCRLLIVWLSISWREFLFEVLNCVVLLLVAGSLGAVAATSFTSRVPVPRMTLKPVSAYTCNGALCLMLRSL